MILRRCPACRTLCDAERDPRCFACGSEFRKDAPPLPQPLPEAQHHARRDTRISNVVLLVFAAIGGKGVFTVLMISELPMALRLLLGGTLVAGAVIGLVTVFKNPGPQHDTAGRVVLKVFAAIGIGVLALTALAVGLLLLLLVMCATGAWRYAG